MSETIQQSARDWQEDWKRLNGIKAIHSVNGFLRAQRYWMQEYRESMMAYATLTCEYQSLKSMFLRMREECGAEKKRADEAEKHLRIIKQSLTSWQEYYIAEGCETELDLTKDILKIIEMLEVIGVE